MTDSSCGAALGRRRRRPGGQAGDAVSEHEAVRLALPDIAQGVACDGCPALPALAQRYAEAGGRMLMCPICFDSRKLSEEDLINGARLGGATPLWEWIGEGATVFSY